MKVNSVDIRKYKAKQLNVTFQPASRSTNAEWITGQKQPTEYETSVGFSKLNLKIYFKAKNRSTVHRTIAEFLNLIQGSVILELDGYKGKYKAFLESDPSVTPTKDLSKVMLELNFKGYMYDDDVKINIIGTHETEIDLVGARDTPCIIEITAKADLSNLKINGFGDDEILIESMQANETLIIDSTLGIVTVNEENAFSKVDMWEFPYITRHQTISMSEVNAQMTIRYKPMWF